MLNFKFIGWCRDHVNNHDKIWGVIHLDNNTYCGKVLIFWGRRGKKLQTKVDYTGVKIDRLVWQKIDGGYHQIQSDKLDKVYPEFQNDLEKSAILSLLNI